MAFGAERRWILGATTRKCSFIPRRSNNEDGAVGPEPFGPMGVATDIIVARQSRWTRIAPSSLLDLGWQDPSALLVISLLQATSIARFA